MQIEKISKLSVVLIKLINYLIHFDKTDNNDKRLTIFFNILKI